MTDEQRWRVYGEHLCNEGRVIRIIGRALSEGRIDIEGGNTLDAFGAAEDRWALGPWRFIYTHRVYSEGGLQDERFSVSVDGTTVAEWRQEHYSEGEVASVPVTWRPGEWLDEFMDYLHLMGLEDLSKEPMGDVRFDDCEITKMALDWLAVRLIPILLSERWDGTVDHEWHEFGFRFKAQAEPRCLWVYNAEKLVLYTSMNAFSCCYKSETYHRILALARYAMDLYRDSLQKVPPRLSEECRIDFGQNDKQEEDNQ
ncbi:MAG: hypothetical protein JW990_03820 [Thermoleophilia bacterium]|nr:hypothetical protein [Thermoleophilia bacterium]